MKFILSDQNIMDKINCCILDSLNNNNSQNHGIHNQKIPVYYYKNRSNNNNMGYGI